MALKRRNLKDASSFIDKDTEVNTALVLQCIDNFIQEASKEDQLDLDLVTRERHAGQSTESSRSSCSLLAVFARPPPPAERPGLPAGRHGEPPGGSGDLPRHAESQKAHFSKTSILLQ